MGHNMGLAQHPADNLFHIDGGRFIGQRCQDIGERAIPPFFQRIDRDDVAHRTITAHQVHILQFVDIGGLDGDLLFRNFQLHQRGLDLLEGFLLLAGFRFGLEQNNRADVLAGDLLLGNGQRFQLAPQLQGVVDHFGLVGPVVDDDRQLDHALLLERQGVHKADDVAVVARGSGQIEDKAGVEVFQHLHRQVGFGVVAFIHHNHRLQGANDVNQCRGVGAFQQVGIRHIE